MEEWKPVKNYEGYYEVSNLGRVRSLPRTWTGRNQFGAQFTINRQGGRILKPDYRRKSGTYEVDKHLRVGLSKEGKTKKFFVHRLVAEAFIPNPNNLPIVNHKDENPQNNCCDNLEWCTHKYNSGYGTAIERRLKNSDFTERSKKQHKKFYQYTKDGELVKVWNSRKEAITAGYTGTAITRCAQGKRKTHKGYIWSFTELTEPQGVSNNAQS